MANQPQMNGIKNSWSLLAFAKAHGKMNLAEFTNGETGDTYKGIAFVNPETKATCFVSFSNNLGELSASEIVDRKNELQVCELNVAPEVAERRAANGRQAESYCLCAIGQNSWQEIDLGI